MFSFALLRPFLPYLLGGVLVTGLYWYVHQQGAAAEKEKAYKQQIVAYMRASDRANSVAEDLEVQLDGLRQQHKQQTERLRNELGKDPVYAECVVPASGVQLLNSARAPPAAPAR